MTEMHEDGNGRLGGVWLAWVWVLPQTVLLWLNLRAWRLVRGDLSVDQRFLAAQVGVFEAVLLFSGMAAFAWCILRRRSIGPWLAVGALALHVAYFWFFLAHMDRIMPAAVTLWMLPETELMFYQFSLMMPAVFLMLVRLARVRTGLSPVADIGISVGLLVGIPMCAYILGMALTRLTHVFNFKWEVMQYFVISGLIATTALILVAFLKLLLRLHAAISRQNWSRWVVPLLAGLVAPLGGLALNAGIPFPYDFQDAAVYALTVVNGAALFIPFRPGFRGSAAGWGVRAVLFPFSLYFFLVFLPFFPLSLLAMIAAGSGILILAPVLLVVVHGRMLFDQGRVLAGLHGGRRIAVLFAACLLVLPAGFVIRCESDRQTLGRAVDAVFSPDYRSKTIEFSRGRLARALRHMEDVKQGIYLPYLTDAYNTIVFHGLVLPDEKVDLIRRSLLGETAARSERSLWGRGVFGGRPQGVRRTRGAGVTHGVEMAAPEIERRATNDVMEVDVRLTLDNRGGENGEFSASVIVPEGVLVTGFWLDVNGTNKPAQLRERKTAVWVYEMIRDMTRRDPGLLVYEGDGRLRLKVYPFSTAQRRRCGMSFRFPSTLHPVIRIKDTPVALNADAQPASTAVSVALPSGGEALALSIAPESGYPQFVRQPAACIILDRSAAAAAAEAGVIRRAKEAIAALPAAVQQVRVMWANYEQESVSGSPEPREAALASLGRHVSLPFRGGFCPELVIARELIGEQGGAGQPVPPPAGLAPLFVVVAADRTSPVRSGALQAFARTVPDMPAYIMWSSNGWEMVAFENGSTQATSPEGVTLAPIMALRKGNTVQMLSSATGGGLVFAPAGSGLGVWECWDPALKAFRPVERLIPCQDSRYAAGIALWARHRALGLDPKGIDAALPGLVADARAAGIMVPETAFVVVETSAQEVMLARKEQQSLGADHALEFDDAKPTPTAPAPSVLWILPLALYLLYRYHRRQQCPGVGNGR